MSASLLEALAMLHPEHLVSLSSRPRPTRDLSRNNSRVSQETFKNAFIVLNSLKQLGDDGWRFSSSFFSRQSIDVADVGSPGILSVRYSRDGNRNVSNNSRSSHGCNGNSNGVLRTVALLDAQSENAAINFCPSLHWQAVAELSQLLDTFYSDVDVYTTTSPSLSLNSVDSSRMKDISQHSWPRKIRSHYSIHNRLALKTFRVAERDVHSRMARHQARQLFFPRTGVVSARSTLPRSRQTHPSQPIKELATRDIFRQGSQSSTAKDVLGWTGDT
ncbi:hypothetical protein MSAN_00913100 [Mycena sanguinolenta]|uniref:Uncharacterized protein n=1 Tax=Mycena sanguinolenta TaxID=230812 RepID=A0A8H6YWL5_9AGAR|nr:hypothetical protein MSAN_00913100 [Mycena sanguinolenta]